jgi:adenylate kinase family enzyme
VKAVVFGPPCGGKTTVANALADRFVGTKLLSMRGMCLREVAHDTFDGRTWWDYERKRLPLPIGLTNRIVGKHLRATPSFVIDGFPKTSEELDFFLDTVGPPTHLFVVQAHFDEIVARARGRFECSDCLTTFPSDIVECPRCHGRLRPRPEDARRA